MLNNIPEAQMKRFLYSGCLLKSVFEVESRYLNFSTRGMFQRGRNVIQVGGVKRKKTESKDCFQHPIF